MNRLFSATLFTVFSTGVLVVAAPSKAQQAQCASGAVLTASCYATPSGYNVTITEMGICSSDPFAGESFDEKVCFATFSGSQTVDVAGGNNQALTGGSSSRPPNGSYPYAYAKMSNVLGITATFNGSSGGAATDFSTNSTATSTYTPSQNTTSGSTAAESLVTLNSFGGTTCTTSTNTSVSSGSLIAYLTTSDYSKASDCTSPAAMVGVFTPSSPFIIEDACLGLLVSFKVSNTGMTIIPNNANGEPQIMLPGEFQPVLSLIK